MFVIWLSTAGGRVDVGRDDEDGVEAIAETSVVGTGGLCRRIGIETAGEERRHDAIDSVSRRLQLQAVVKPRRLTPWNQRDSTRCHADRSPIYVPNYTRGSRTCTWLSRTPHARR